MKRTVIAILFLVAISNPFKAKAQVFGLDTIKITNFILKAGDWAYLANNTYFPRTDSLSNDFMRQLQTKFDTSTLASGFNTHIRVDSIRGHTLFTFYQVYKASNHGDLLILGDFIGSQVAAVVNTPFQNAIGALNTQINSLFVSKRQTGFRFLKK